MESLIVSLLSGDLSVTTLLLLFIIAVLTKRFVPWWVYDSLVAELKVYKEQTPDLLDEIQHLFEVIKEEKDKTEVAHGLQIKAEGLQEKAEDARKEIEQADGNKVKQQRVRPRRTSGRRGRRNE